MRKDLLSSVLLPCLCISLLCASLLTACKGEEPAPKTEEVPSPSVQRADSVSADDVEATAEKTRDVGSGQDLPLQRTDQIESQSAEVLPPSHPVEDLPAPDAVESARADELLAFYNQGVVVLDTGWYALADILQEQMSVYFKVWQLAPRPRMTISRTKAQQALLPPEGLFSEEEVARLEQAVQKMDRSLDSILADYRAMGRYVEDTSIRDDGARGQSLAFSIDQAHALFVDARQEWLSLVEGHARRAENILLYDHPLKRQIQGAARVFALFDETVGLLKAEKADRATLQHVWQELTAELSLLERPPFQGKAGLERLYRRFLSAARDFAALLERGIREGFYQEVREGLNTAQVQSRIAYNIFAREASNS